MKYLHAPWRGNYIKNKGNRGKDRDCPFCAKNNSENLKEQLILKKFQHCMVLMNLYPYNAGHLLVIPHRHTSHLHELTREERLELLEVTCVSLELLEQVFECDGMNMGMNKGKASGGSVPEHLHIHLLPRFVGDTGFLPILADTKAISFDFHRIYDFLLPHFENLKID